MPNLALRTVAYGAFASQKADLHLPGIPRPPVACLLHGGFWRMPYGRDQMTAMARDLAQRGFAVWNLGYRRVGEPGGGWPGTLEDVSAGIRYLASLAAQGTDLDLGRLVLVGHSAGGHLALLAASSAAVRPSAIVGLAPVLDLAGTHALGSPVGAFLGGAPGEDPERYAAASPLARLPLGVRQLIVHGTADEALPVELARTYTRKAREAGDAIELIELPGAGHMDYLDPTSEAYATLARWLTAQFLSAPSSRRS